MESAARPLAVAAVRGRLALAPEAVRAAYRDFLLDTVAVMAAGAAHPSISGARAALLATGGAGPASAVGHPEGGTPAIAALVNGAAMTVLQLQDGHRRARGHPMSHVLPAALALAEETGADTAAFLDAVTAGYEVSARIGTALGGMQPLLHDTGTFGTIGAAVAAAHLLGPRRDEAARVDLIEAAIGNAAAVALFPFRDTCMEGAGVHHLFVGLGAQNGVHAARAALAGLLPAQATLERFFGPRAGEGFDPAVLAAGIDPGGGWAGYEILHAYLKWHPVCAHLGPMVDCIETLRARLGNFDAEAIEQVQVDVYSTALQYDSPMPQTDLAARFSFRHTAALALLDGPLRHDSFAPESLRRAGVQALAMRVRPVADPSFDALYPASRPSRVTLLLRGGGRESAEVTVPKGDGPRTLSAEDVRAKAKTLMSDCWDDAHAQAIVALLDGIVPGQPKDLPARLGRLLRRAFRGG